MAACNRLTCQNCNSTRTRVSWAVQNQTLRPHGKSLSRFATFTLSRALSTATSANETPTQKLERVADELLDLTKIERHDYSILFRLKMGLNRYGPAVSGIGSASSESGPASADSKVVEKTAFDIKIEKFDAAAKIKIIKEVRTFTDLGLKEAKELVEKAPVVVKKGVTKEEAGPIVDKLKELGATVRDGVDGDRCREGIVENDLDLQASALSFESLWHCADTAKHHCRYDLVNAFGPHIQGFDSSSVFGVTIMKVIGLCGLGFSRCGTKGLAGMALWISSVAEEDVE
ncbi:unnamed protein product [Prunus armeniaca]